jgi:hypothetical protein
VIFNGVISDVFSLVDDIKVIAWMWFTSHFGGKSYIAFSSWCINPMDCLHSTL